MASNSSVTDRNFFSLSLKLFSRAVSSATHICRLCIMLRWLSMREV